MREGDYPELNLPAVALRLREVEGRAKVYDFLRRKYVALTPEEYVRQHFVEYLAEELHYRRGLMANEVSISVNGLRRRCDTLVSDRAGRPFMVVEYKAPSVAVTQEVFDQIARYNMAIGARYLVVTNGLSHYCCVCDSERGEYRFLPAIPDGRESENENRL